MTENELVHYGVKGMKWGVRRYQNYDGSYTRKGVARFQKASSEYDSAVSKTKQAKAAYKAGTATRKDVNSAKKDVKTAKKNMEKSYKRLKTDKLADEGRELYKQGKTISGNTQLVMLRQAGVIMGARVAQALIQSTTGKTNIAALASNTIAIGGTAVNAALAAKSKYENKRLRAYYAH